MAEKAKSLTVILSVVIAFVSLGTTVVVLASDRQATVSEVSALKSTAADHEMRLRSVENLVTRIDENVKIIKKNTGSNSD